ncbi:undecaprenyl-diphosphate phosphatase [Pelagibacteraceae bacterium]|nr:undecaprenyl-diphosphate phosphatase [Pelagibacteraceae bacterium]
MFELQYFIIGIAQGFTEFLPISSSGHLVLISELTSWQDQGLFTDVAVHVGTLLAVIIYLRPHITALIKSLFSFQLAQNKNLIKVIVATIPAVIVGFFIFNFVQLYFRDIKVVAVSSVVFAALLFVADHFKMKISSWENMSYVQAFIIGVFQVLAFIPGASRAGVTITGARFLGFDRSSAAIFSMLLSVPIILASLVLTSFDLIISAEVNINLYQSLFAAIVAYITALLSINIMMKIIQRYTFNIFIIYRVILGFILLYFYA